MSTRISPFQYFKGLSNSTCLNYLFIYLWLCWVLVSVRGISPVAASGGHSSSRCAGLSLSRPLLLRSTGSRRAGSAIVVHRPSRSAACGIFPDQGSNPCPLHWQADSQPLRHQGSPNMSKFDLMTSIPPQSCLFSSENCNALLWNKRNQVSSSTPTSDLAPIWLINLHFLNLSQIHSHFWLKSPRPLV